MALPQRQSTLVKKRRDLLSKVKQLQDLCYLVQSESMVDKLTLSLEEVLHTARNHLRAQQTNECLLIRSPKKKPTKCQPNISQTKPISSQTKKHPYSGRFGIKAEMMKQFYRAKLVIPDEEKPRSVITTYASDVPDNDVAQEVIIHAESTLQNEAVITKIMPGDNKHNVQKFTKDMENEIGNDKKLSNKTINYAQYLLHQQFPQTQGFEDTSDIVKFSRMTGKFVQILHTGQDHWIVCSGSAEKDTIYIYDSMSNGGLTAHSTKCIAEMMYSKEKILHLIKISVQQQQNSVDCGVFAVAFATSLSLDIDPSCSSFDVSQMRIHLLRCFEKGEMTMFPLSSKRSKKCRQIMNNVDIYCRCRMPFFEEELDKNKGMFMAHCIGCDDWYHRQCEKIPNKVFKNQDEANTWKCSICSR